MRLSTQTTACLLGLAVFCATPYARAQVTGSTPAPATIPGAPPSMPATTPGAPALYSPIEPAAKMPAEQLEQLVAPIALYPDSLLSQILMASTYPLEVVQAQRFAKTNEKLTGTALAAELEKQPWDASVKSLVNFPTVLDMMSDKLDTTIKLGDAFIDDQKSVLDAVQRLRAKAKAQGNLESTKEQKIVVEQAPQSDVQVISIQPANPEVVYVPTYNPTVVYGSWPYPAYPPYYWYPPGYAYSGMIGFGVGFGLGLAWGYAWGNCNWGGGDIDIDINRNFDRNTNIDRSKFQNRANQLPSNGGRLENGRGNWQHDPSHRDGVAYRDKGTAQRFGGANNNAVQARDAFRGRSDAGLQDLSRGGASEFRGAGAPSPSIANRGGVGAGGGGIGAGNRPAAGGGSPFNRPSTGMGNPSVANRGSGLSGVGGGGNAARVASNRGAVSRAPSAAARPSGGVSRPAGGMSRPAGGGARAGGGGGRR